jgi:murein DD-endopeptidase MepM/ murein hydrolase activator NlpD
MTDPEELPKSYNTEPPPGFLENWEGGVLEEGEGLPEQDPAEARAGLAAEAVEGQVEDARDAREDLSDEVETKNAEVDLKDASLAELLDVEPVGLKDSVDAKNPLEDFAGGERKRAEKDKGWFEKARDWFKDSGIGAGIWKGISKLGNLVDGMFSGLNDFWENSRDWLRSILGLKPKKRGAKDKKKEKDERLKDSLEVLDPKAPIFTFPADATPRISSGYGMRDDPMNPSVRQDHKGVDIVGLPEGTPILCTKDKCKVLVSSYNENGGHMVFLQMPGGKVAGFMHLKEKGPKKGTVLNVGDRIGLVGNTGKRTTNPHLHFEVRNSLKRDFVNPMSYLPQSLLDFELVQGVRLAVFARRAAEGGKTYDLSGDGDHCWGWVEAAYKQAGFDLGRSTMIFNRTGFQGEATGRLNYSDFGPGAHIIYHNGNSVPNSEGRHSAILLKWIDKKNGKAELASYTGKGGHPRVHTVDFDESPIWRVRMPVKSAKIEGAD